MLLEKSKCDSRVVLIIEAFNQYYVFNHCVGCTLVCLKRNSKVELPLSRNGSFYSNQ